MGQHNVSMFMARIGYQVREGGNYKITAYFQAFITIKKTKAPQKADHYMIQQLFTAGTLESGIGMNISSCQSYLHGDNIGQMTGLSKSHSLSAPCGY